MNRSRRPRAIIWIVAPLVWTAASWIGCTGSDLVMTAQRVHDVDPGRPQPRYVLVVIVENPTSEPIEITGPPTLSVRAVHSGGQLEVLADPIDRDPQVAVPAHGRIEAFYDLWRLANLFRQGSFPELRSAPGEMRFRLAFETTSGQLVSSEWADVSSGNDVGELMRELRRVDL